VFPENAVIEAENIPQPVVVTQLRPHVHTTVTVKVASGLETIANVSSREESLPRRVIAAENAHGYRPEVLVAFLWEIMGVSRCDTEPPVRCRHKLTLDIGP